MTTHEVAALYVDPPGADLAMRITAQLSAMAARARSGVGASWEHGARSATTLENAVILIEQLMGSCELAYKREPTQAEGDAFELKHDQGVGPSHGVSECHVPMGDHHGHRCSCGAWVWGGPVVCQRCAGASAVKIASEWKAEADRLRDALLTIERTGAPGGAIMAKRSDGHACSWCRGMWTPCPVSTATIARR